MAFYLDNLFDHVLEFGFRDEGITPEAILGKPISSIANKFFNY